MTTDGDADSDEEIKVENTGTGAIVIRNLSSGGGYSSIGPGSTSSYSGGLTPLYLGPPADPSRAAFLACGFLNDELSCQVLRSRLG